METFTGRKAERQFVLHGECFIVASYREKIPAIFRGIFETFHGVLNVYVFIYFFIFCIIYLFIFLFLFLFFLLSFFREPLTFCGTRVGKHWLERVDWNKRTGSRCQGNTVYVSTCLRASTSNSVFLSNRVALHDSNSEHILESINIIFEFSGDVETMRVVGGSCLVTRNQMAVSLFLMVWSKRSLVSLVAFLLMLLFCRFGPSYCPTFFLQTLFIFGIYTQWLIVV
jgi:hypothetical protein